MCLKISAVAILLVCAIGAHAKTNFVVTTTTLAAQTSNNTSAANSFVSQSNGNAGAGNISKINVHSLLYSGATTKVYAHLLLWFGPSNHMNVGYSSTDPVQIHRQITDMISRGIDGVIIDWYGPNNSIDQATQLVMAEAEKHPGFTFAIMIDQGAIKWDSCSGCSPQQALIAQLQYIEQTYFPSSAYMTEQGQPVITNFNIDLAYSINWDAVNAALSTKPVYLFQNNDGFTHVLSDGSYSWVMPTTTDYGMSYLTSFYDTGIPLTSEETVGASYKGFNDSLAAWGSGRVMGQQCGQTWFSTFSKINGIYNSGRQLPALQLVTWNDYEEGTEIESGINNCFAVSANVSGNALRWSTSGNTSTIDHYVAFISTDGENLMALGTSRPGTDSLNLCSYGTPNGNYVLYVQAVGKPSITNQISAPVTFTSTCTSGSASGSLTLGTTPSAINLTAGGSARVTVTATPNADAFNSAVALACSGLPSTLACSFNPASITPGSSAVNSVLTISDTPVASLSKHDGGFSMSTWLLSFGMIGCVLMGRVQRKRVTLVLGSLCLTAMIIGGASCGRNPTSAIGAPRSGSYTVTINGSSGSVQASATVNVTVQ